MDGQEGNLFLSDDSGEIFSSFISQLSLPAFRVIDINKEAEEEAAFLPIAIARTTYGSVPFVVLPKTFIEEHDIYIQSKGPVEPGDDPKDPDPKPKE